MINEALYSSKTEEWETPEALFKMLDEEFHFTLDPCCTKENAKCKKYYTKQENGLNKNWEGERVFCNPPYGREIAKWVCKCSTGGADLCVMLLPSRTDTAWFHDFVYKKAEIRFLRGRIKFGNAKNGAPFPSMICIFQKKKDE